MIRSTIASAVLTVALLAGQASGQSFNSAGGISIPNAGTGTPYPSTINVAGGPASIASITVRLNNLTHTFPGDIDVLLVGPGGQTVVLMSDLGSSTSMVDETFTFTSIAGAPSANATPFTGGIFAPTNLGAADPFAAPAPAGPYGASFATFVGTNANGVWSLYVVDDAGGDLGSFAGGWSITFDDPPSPQPTSNTVTYQGKLTNGAVPVTGNIDVRVTYHRTEFDALGGIGSQTSTNVPCTDGLFNLRLSPGGAFFDNRELWIELEVRSPAGIGPYTPLAGRQRITPAPSATWASSSGNAQRAAFAPQAGSVVSPDQTLSLVSGDNFGNVGIAGPFVSTGASSVTIQGRSGTGLNQFGGMYVNTPAADAWPFMGFSSAGSIRSFWYHDTTQNYVGFWNSGYQFYIRNNGVTVGTSTLTAGNRFEVAGAIRATAFNVASSQRYKENVKDLGPVLDRFDALRPVSYDWNATVSEDLRGKHTLGLIAEEVYTLFPDAVSLDSEGKPASIDYSRITALSIQAIKDLKAQQATKDAELTALKARLEAIEKALLGKGQ